MYYVFWWCHLLCLWMGCSQGAVIVSPSLVVVISFIDKLFLLNGTVIALSAIGFFLQGTVISRCTMFDNLLMINGGRNCDLGGWSVRILTTTLADKTMWTAGTRS
jgi:hypothetical protein